MQRQAFRPRSAPRLSGTRLQIPVNRQLKRVLDIVVSSVACATLVPVVIPIVLLIQQVQSPGDLFYFQTRVGLGNKRFRLVKFRTMHSGHGLDAKQVVRGDSRIFPAGRLLRKLSIDELPQLWNVLRGDMSLVGPRPHMVEHHELFKKMYSKYDLRTEVLPGITGLAQVRGLRGETSGMCDIAMRVSSDLYYIANWSIRMDLEILARTALQILSPPESAK